MKIKSTKDKSSSTRSYFKSTYISSVFLKARIDTTRPMRQTTAGMYQRYGLRYYSSKEEFYSNFKDKFSTKKIETMWREYSHRDKLIATGQYKEIKAKNIIKSYIKSIKRITSMPADFSYMKSLLNVEKNLLALNSISSDKVLDLFQSPNTEYSTSTLMPSFEELYALEGAISSYDSLEQFATDDYSKSSIKRDISDFERKVMMAFESIGVKYKVFYSSDSVEQDITSTFLRTVPKYYRKEYYTGTISSSQARDILLETYKARSKKALERGKTIIYRTKAGREYIPFVKRSVSDEIIAALYASYGKTKK